MARSSNVSELATNRIGLFCEGFIFNPEKTFSSLLCEVRWCELTSDSKTDSGHVKFHTSYKE